MKGEADSSPSIEAVVHFMMTAVCVLLLLYMYSVLCYILVEDLSMPCHGAAPSRLLLTATSCGESVVVDEGT